MKSDRDGKKLSLIVFVVGMTTLGAEIAAARLLAPWFGASTIVWANTIAIVLVALAIGYSVGGRYADRHPHLDGLLRLILIAALLLTAVPFIARPFLRSSAMAFSEMSLGIFVGSLFSVGALVAIPLLLLGMVSPYAVRLAMDSVDAAGTTTGRLYAIGTLGSLVGTFSASLLLIPYVGTRRTFLIFSLSLVLLSLLGTKRRWLGGLAALLIIGLISLPVQVTKGGSAGDRLLKEVETEYQYASVLKRDDRLLLELNEGQALHSVYTRGKYLNDGYWDHMALLTMAADHPRRIAILGSAAGTTSRTIAHYFPQVRIDSVEIDPELTRIGNELFDARAPQVHQYTGDARPWLQARRASYDAILVDAYRQPYIPFYLTTREFFTLARDRLSRGGLVAINVGHPPGSDQLEKTLAATLRSVFGQGHVYRDVVDEFSTMLVATTSQVDPGARLQAITHDDWQIPALAQQIGADLRPALRGGPIYTDDKAPVEWLIDASFADLATTK